MNFLLNKLKKACDVIAESQQAKANRMVAEMLQRSEYPNESVEYIESKLRQGKIGEL